MKYIFFNKVKIFYQPVCLHLEKKINPFRHRVPFFISKLEKMDLQTKQNLRTIYLILIRTCQLHELCKEKHIYVLIVFTSEIEWYEKGAENKIKKRRRRKILGSQRKGRVGQFITCGHAEVGREERYTIKCNKTRNSFESIVFGFQLSFEVLIQVYL